jgi:hypothetical protein
MINKKQLVSHSSFLPAFILSILSILFDFRFKNLNASNSLKALIF